MSADVLGTDLGDSADCCVLAERTVLALVSEKNSNEVRQSITFFQNTTEVSQRKSIVISLHIELCVVRFVASTLGYRIMCCSLWL